jgi:16S rRNA (guanine527-N7)-methyltransferase
MKNTLINLISEINLNINSCFIDPLIKFWNFLLETNNKINLISRVGDNKNKFIAHIIDSLTGLLFNWPANISHIDLGSGGGLPAIPLRICQPGWSTTLVESTTKKARFLEEAIESLGLEKTVVRNVYLEPRSSWPGPVHDLATTRGFATIKESLPLVVPCLKSGGWFLTYKGPRATEELAMAARVMAKLKIRLVDHKELILPELNVPRSIILFQKD